MITMTTTITIIITLINSQYLYFNKIKSNFKISQKRVIMIISMEMEMILIENQNVR